MYCCTSLYHRDWQLAGSFGPAAWVRYFWPGTAAVPSWPLRAVLLVA